MPGIVSSGNLEGAGILGDIGKFFKKAGKATVKFLKKTKLISRGAPVLASALALFPETAAAAGAVRKVGEFAGQKGFGPRRKPVRLGRPPRPITRSQLACIKAGLCNPLASGGVSMALGRKHGMPQVKNITPAQIRALRAGQARLMKGGGISLSGGRASGMFIRGNGLTPAGVGRGLKLAGQGHSGGRGAHRGRGRR